MATKNTASTSSVLPRVKKWTQLCPEDFTNPSISPSGSPVTKRRHSAPPEQLLFHTYPHIQQSSSNQPHGAPATDPPSRLIFHHHPYMNKTSGSGRRNSQPSMMPPPVLRRGSTPSVMQAHVAPGPSRRRLSLPHNTVGGADSLPKSSSPALQPPYTTTAPSSAAAPGKLAEFNNMNPLIKIVEEEMAHAQEFEIHKIHSATAKMHISNLLV